MSRVRGAVGVVLVAAFAAVGLVSIAGSAASAQSLTCEIGVLEGDQCVVEGPPPTLVGGGCPSAADIVQDGADCFRLVPAQVGAACVSPYMWDGGDACIADAVVADPAVPEYSCPATAGATAILDAAVGRCLYPAPIGLTCADGVLFGDVCRVPVDPLDGEPVCEAGYTLDGSRCVQYFDPEVEPGRVVITYAFECVGEGTAQLTGYSATTEGGASVALISLNGSANIARELPGGVDVVWSVTTESASDEIVFEGPAATPACRDEAEPTPTPEPTATPEQTPTVPADDVQAEIAVEVGPCDVEGNRVLTLDYSGLPDDAVVQWYLDGEPFGPPQVPATYSGASAADGQPHTVELLIVEPVGVEGPTERIVLPICDDESPVAVSIELDAACDAEGNRVITMGVANGFDGVADDVVVQWYIDGEPFGSAQSPGSVAGSVPGDGAEHLVELRVVEPSGIVAPAGEIVEFAPCASLVIAEVEVTESCDVEGLVPVRFVAELSPADPDVLVQWYFDGQPVGPVQEPGPYVDAVPADGQLHQVRVEIVAPSGATGSAEAELMLPTCEADPVPSIGVETGDCDAEGNRQVTVTSSLDPTVADAAVQWYVDGQAFGPVQAPGSFTGTIPADGMVHTFELRVVEPTELAPTSEEIEVMTCDTAVSTVGGGGETATGGNNTGADTDGGEGDDGGGGPVVVVVVAVAVVVATAVTAIIWKGLLGWILRHGKARAVGVIRGLTGKEADESDDDDEEQSWDFCPQGCHDAPELPSTIDNNESVARPFIDKLRFIYHVKCQHKTAAHAKGSHGYGQCLHLPKSIHPGATHKLGFISYTCNVIANPSHFKRPHGSSCPSRPKKCKHWVREHECDTKEARWWRPWEVALAALHRREVSSGSPHEFLLDILNPALIPQSGRMNAYFVNGIMKGKNAAMKQAAWIEHYIDDETAAGLHGPLLVHNSNELFLAGAQLDQDYRFPLRGHDTRMIAGGAIAVYSILLHGMQNGSDVFLIGSSGGTLQSFIGVHAFMRKNAAQAAYLKSHVRMLHLGCLVHADFWGELDSGLVSYEKHVDLRDPFARSFCGLGGFTNKLGIDVKATPYSVSAVAPTAESMANKGFSSLQKIYHSIESNYMARADRLNRHVKTTSFD